MTELVARTGRNRQRYEDGYRLVAGCIPYRHAKTDDEVLMITSRSGPGLIFPKGGWENDESVEEAAQREALEEAGVRGEMKKILGSWEFKSKSPREEDSPEGLCKAVVFPLCVTQELDSWPEQDVRQRQWLSIEDALKQCRHDWMREALEQCREFLKQCREALNCCSQLSDQEQS
uniref:Nudix hydrolase domain-containing protein n=1 Tax=Araucaria cunninghamii TaxID=56994 RepID=A0A0D6RA52_ARACU